MPNLAFHQQVLNQLQSPVSPIPNLSAAAASLVSTSAANAPFALLGALGPDLLRYLPVSQLLAKQLQKLGSGAVPIVNHRIITNGLPTVNLTAADLAEIAAKPDGAMYSLVFSVIVEPNWPLFLQVTSTLASLQGAVNAKDTAAVLLLLPELSTALQNAQTLAQNAKKLNNNALEFSQVTQLIIGLAQPTIELRATPVTSGSPPYDSDRLFELLRWHWTGEFAAELLNRAQAAAASGGPQEQAYAVGWLSHFAGSVVGAPFINNITGGPYRTHWWRSRLVENFVDSWVFGFFETPAQPMTQLPGAPGGPPLTPAADIPNPPYAQWSPLCEANLQADFDVAGFGPAPAGQVHPAVSAVATGNLALAPGALPANIAALIFDTAHHIYETIHNGQLPKVFNQQQQLTPVTAQTFADAFVGAFAAYWFMTLQGGPMSDQTPGGAPCPAPPFITSGTPPTPQQAGLNVPGAIGALILAILAMLAFLASDLAAGIAALVAALNTGAINWSTAQCTLFWVSNTVFQLEGALRDMLVNLGVAYPIPRHLGTNLFLPGAQSITQPAVDATPKPTGNQFQTSGLGYVNQLGGAAMGVALTRTNDLTTDPAVFVGANAVGHYPLQMDAPPFAIGQITVNPDMSIWFPITSKNEEDPWPNLTDAGLYANSLFPVPGNPLAPPPQSILAPTLFPAQPAQTFGDAVHAAAAVIDGALVNNLPNFNLDADRGYGFAPGWHPKPGTNPSVPPVDVALD